MAIRVNCKLQHELRGWLAVKGSEQPALALLKRLGAAKKQDVTKSEGLYGAVAVFHS